MAHWKLRKVFVEKGICILMSEGEWLRLKYFGQIEPTIDAHQLHYRTGRFAR
jgi:hypothetical protein